jgi:hypothetical protein
MATTCMETADVNKDGEIDFDEFKAAVMKNQVTNQNFFDGKDLMELFLTVAD